jgi:hypothetical protein
LPRLGRAKPALCLVALTILAGCGGSAAPQGQIVRGSGFRFQAPAGWTVTGAGEHVSAAQGKNLVRAETFMLLKPYRHALLGPASRELDTKTGQLASAMKARIASRKTRTVAGHDARTYVLRYDDQQQQITYVLDGSREYELICRLAAGADEAPCAQLLTTFAVGS